MIYIACDASFKKGKSAIAYTVFNSVTGDVATHTKLSNISSGKAEYEALVDGLRYASTLQEEVVVYTDQIGLISVLEKGGKTLKAKAKDEVLTNLITKNISVAKVESHKNTKNLAQALHRISDGEAAKLLKIRTYPNDEHYKYLEEAILVYSEEAPLNIIDILISKLSTFIPNIC